MRCNAGPLSFAFCHHVQNARRANRRYQRDSAASILNGCFGASGLADVVDELDRALRLVGNSGPPLGYGVDCVVIVFRDPVR